MSLQGLAVVITRPMSQSQPLGEKILAARGQPYLFPTLEIVPLELEAADKDVLLAINSYDLCIFTSVNAVRNATPYLPPITHAKVAAIGPSTAKALNKIDIRVDVQPRDVFSSEGLLAEDVFQDVQGKKILIITGEGGRGLLEQSLTARAANVSTVIVYKRQKPSNTKSILEIIPELNKSVVISTSCQSLDNLISILTTPEAVTWLQKTQLLVISERMRIHALSIGIAEGQIILARNASDEAILDSLIKWYSNAQ